jgi:ketosteroid isomerase-like protein
MIRCLPALVLALILPASTAFAQNTDTLTREQKIAEWKAINRDVWKPFSEAYAANDVEKYLALHTADFLRVSDRRILTKPQYTDEQRGHFQRRKEKNISIMIEFRLTERAVTAAFASERGIYHTVSGKGTPNERSHYGKFHVLFRKDNGTWKITMDYDSDEQRTINAKSFEEAFALEDWGKY